MNARLYDYGSGVFTSTDPLFADMQRAGGLNAYGYVYGNPFSFTDPSGKNGVALGQAIMRGTFGAPAFTVIQAQNCRCETNTASIFIPDYNYQIQVGGLSDDTYRSLRRVGSNQYESLVAASANGNVETMTLSRGDNSGKQSFVANGVEKRGVDASYRELASAGNLAEDMVMHAFDSGDSLFVSTTDTYGTAEIFAAHAKQNGPASVYTLQVPAGRAILNIFNRAPSGIDNKHPISGAMIFENEWLVPLFIPNEWISNETSYTGPAIGY